MRDRHAKKKKRLDRQRNPSALLLSGRGIKTSCRSKATNNRWGASLDSSSQLTQASAGEDSSQ